MDEWKLLLEIILLLALSMALGVLFERLRQSAILGYLLAGTLVGPGALGLIGQREAVAAMAELGVAMLLFSIGLEFSYRRLRSLGPIAAGGGALQVVATMLVAAGVAALLGQPIKAAIAIGCIVALSSTACVLRILIDRAEIDSVHGRNALGILLLQDIALVPLMLLVTALGGEGSAGEVIVDTGKSVGVAALLVVGFYLLSRYLLPRALDATAMLKNRELPILLAVVTCLAATWTAHALKLSPALGAFVAGVLLAESPFATQIRADVSALRTLFVTLFFTSIGMLSDLPWLSVHVVPVMGVVLAILAGKTAIIFGVARLFQSSARAALATGFCLAQVGEFSFVLAQTALGFAVIPQPVFKLMVSATLVTLFITPYLVRLAPGIAAGLTRWWARLCPAATPPAEPAEPAEPPEGHVLVIGYGPAGQQVVEALVHAEVPAVIVDLNPRTIAAARREGHDAHVGDATHRDVLEHLRLGSARAVVVTVPDHRAAASTVRLVRSLMPQMPIVVRGRYHVYVDDLRAAGADVVADEEQRIGQLLGREVSRLVTRISDEPRAAGDE